MKSSIQSSSVLSCILARMMRRSSRQSSRLANVKGAPLNFSSSKMCDSPMASIHMGKRRAVLLVICIHWPSLVRATM